MSDTALRYLVGSVNRRRALAALRTDGPLTRRDLEARTSASRRTVTRTLDELVDRGWVRRVDDGYDATALGATVLDALDDASDRIDLATRFGPLLRHLPDDAVDLDVRTLAGATLVGPTEGDPYAAMNRLHELRADADYVRELAPALCLDGVEQLADRIESEADPPDVESVVESTALEPAASPPEVESELERIAAAESGAVRTCDDAVPFVLGVYDEAAVVCALNDDGIPVALLETTNPDVRDWATETYRAYRERSASVDR